MDTNKQTDKQTDRQAKFIYRYTFTIKCNGIINLVWNKLSFLLLTPSLVLTHVETEVNGKTVKPLKKIKNTIVLKQKLN